MESNQRLLKPYAANYPLEKDDQPSLVSRGGAYAQERRRFENSRKVLLYILMKIGYKLV